MVIRIAISLLVSVTVSGGSALAAKPEVFVTFEVAVPEFNDSLPELEQAKRSVREALAAELGRQYVFATWRATDPEEQVGFGRLVLRMEADRQTHPMPTVFVRFWGSSTRPDAELTDLGFDPIAIYVATDPNWDTNDRRAFESRVLEKTMDKVRTSAFRDEVFSRFISRLPIGSSVVPDTSDQVIEIPVRWDELLLSSESELVVRFDKGNNQTRQAGTMTLGQIAARVLPETAAPQNDFSASLRGSVTRASFDARPIVLNDQHWNDDLPTILNGVSAACYISVYKPLDPLAGDSDRFGL